MSDFEKGKMDLIKKKRLKAKKYALEPERFKLLQLVVEMDSEHDVRILSFKENAWSCTCEFYKEYNICSHIMALEEILQSIINDNGSKIK